MDFIHIIILAILQGLTEFLPISSSGHLILAPVLFNFQVQGLALDAILHLGTLMAIIIFFRKDLLELLTSLWDKNADGQTRRLAWGILLATVPAGSIGLLFGDWIGNNLRSPAFVAINMIIWSFVFFAADQLSASRPDNLDEIKKLTLKQVLFIGCAQAIALLPGTSRSGITIAAGLFGKLSKGSAARFSFLLGTPIILAAGLHKFAEFFFYSGELGYSGVQLGAGLLVSFVVGYFSIQLLLTIVTRLGLLPFIIYRIVLATGILLFYST